MNIKKYYFLFILFFLTSCSDDVNVQSVQPTRIQLIRDKFLMTTGDYSDAFKNVFTDINGYDIVSIDDPQSLRDFQALYSRMKDSCEVNSDSPTYDHNYIMRSLIVDYPDHIDTLLFDSLEPDGIISNGKAHYRDSLMYYYTVYQLAERDSSFRKEEAGWLILEQAFAHGRYNHMCIRAQNSYRKRLDDFMHIVRKPARHKCSSNKKSPMSLDLYYSDKMILVSDYVTMKPDIFTRNDCSVIRIEDQDIMKEFHILYNRMKSSCFVGVDQRPEEQVQLMAIRVNYPKGYESIAFLSIYPDGEIEVSNNVYVDSELYQFTTGLIAARDSAFSELQSRRDARQSLWTR